ncbi:hypothetical protein JIN85_11390 [Luteolibacter pohnpeiensis]|uniref:Lipoprotein n=1 Tax=Luteolibacter pohnpeiensis TaxID=454153 RepID=A0A934S6A9_9BACT|nr:hypothetical protein [Luteolibacter pohnpeiensis]
MSRSILSLILSCLLVGACAPTHRWLSRTPASAANDQMMLVRNDPNSFGYQRLMLKTQEFPDLKIFVEDTGLPDYFAETSSGDRQYLIFYYLKQRQAFACRAKSPHSNAVEFSGPYSITDREYRLLSQAKSDAAAKRQADAA